MADKTPVRVVFNSDNVATGMAEFQSGESIAVANGGTGLTAVGSAGQVLKVNAAGSGLEFGAEGDISITNLVAPTNSDLTLTTSGTGNIILDAITIRGTTITSADSSIININEGVVVDGTLNTSGQATLSGLAYPTSDGTVGQFLQTDGSGTLAFADLSLGDLTIIGSTISVPSNADFTLDPSGTGAIKLNANTDITGNLTVTGTLDLGDSNFTNVGSLQLDSIAGDGDTNTSITFSGSDVITVATGGSTALTVNADQSVTLNSTNKLNFNDTGTHIFSNADGDLDIVSDGTATDSIKLTSAGAITLDANGTDGTGSIKLDSAYGEVALMKNATTFSQFFNLSSGLRIRTATSNADMTFAGNDGGASITALTLDMSEAGTATFNHDVILPNNGILQLGDAGENIVGDGTDLTISSSNEINTVSAGTGNNSTLLTSAGGIYLDANGNAIRLDATTTVNLYQAATLYGSFNHASSVFEIISKISNGDLKLKGVDDGSEITALTLDMSEAGAATFNSTVTLGSNNAIQFVDANESVKSDGTNLIFTSGGTTFKMPTSDGSAGQALITDGAGTLSFDTVSTTTSSDTRAIIKNNKTVNTSARTVDYFQAAAFDMAWYFVALNDMTNDNTSGSVFTVCHNNSDAFIGGPRGGAAGSTNAMPTTSADIASSQVRVKITGPSADSKISFYKIPISRASTSDATAGVTVTTSNTDVDSASESIDTFAHASFRAAKYVILIDDNAKTETGVTEALVVHDGTNAFVTQYGTLQTGNNDMITLSAAISGSNVVLSAAGLTPNLSLKIHKTLLADSMTAESNANQKIIGATTVSSTATAFDSFDLDDATAAVYYVVGKNATEGAYSVQEVYLSGDIGEAGVSSGPFVSSKATTQLEFTGDFLDTTDNTVQLSISSTSGGSTTVNAYRINCLAGE